MAFIKNLSIIIYQVLALALISSFLFTAAELLKGESSWKQIVQHWLREFRKNGVFRCCFFLMVSAFGILGITVLTRRIWYTPWSNVIGNFPLIAPNGKQDEDICNNILLFIPFGDFLFASGIKKVDKFVRQEQKLRLWRVLMYTSMVSAGFSFGIELCQSVFWLGTFQLADIFYNAIGGLMGGVLYYIGRQLRNKELKRL